MSNNVIQNKTTCAIISFIIFVLILRNSLYTEASPTLHLLLSGLRFVSLGIFVLLYIRSPKKIDGIGFWLILYGLIIGYSTITHQTDSPFVIISIGFDILLIWGLCKLYLTSYGQYILQSIIVSMSFCIYINFILLHLHPEGLWIVDNTSYYLLGGNYNQMGRTIIPALAIAGYYRIKYNKMKLNYALLVICSLFTLFFVESKTSIVGILLLLTFYFIKSYRLRKWLGLSFIIFYLLFQLVVVFVQQDLSDKKHITYFVEEVLHKDLTFSNRTGVWTKSIKLIQESPINGYGYQSGSWYKERLEVTTAHNIILEQLITGGILGLSVFIIMIIAALRKYSMHPDSAMQFLFLGLCTYFFMMIMEVYPMTYIVLLLILLYNTKKLASDESITQETKSE